MKYLECKFNDKIHKASMEVRLNTQAIPKKNNCKYLGWVIQGRGDINDDVTHRIVAVWMM